MAYSDVVRIGPEPETGGAITAVGDILVFFARRPCRILGWGIGTTSAFTAGTGAVGGTFELQHSVNGGAYATRDTLALPNANHALGMVLERSELLRGRSPQAPEAVLTGFDVNPGDLVRIRVTTAQVAGTGGVAGAYAAYLLVSPKGSL